jgi:hypothetical protein
MMMVPSTTAMRRLTSLRVGLEVSNKRHPFVFTGSQFDKSGSLYIASIWFLLALLMTVYKK